MMITLLAVVHEHADSVIALRIFFSICLAAVLFARIYIFRIRKRLFNSDLEKTGDNYGARNLCLDPRDGSVDHGAVEVVASQFS